MNSKPRLSTRRKACDACKKRKTRCEIIPESDATCSYCNERGRLCTFTDSSPKEKLTSRQYIAVLEEKVARLEALLGETSSDKTSPTPDPKLSDDDCRTDPDPAVEILSKYLRSMTMQQDGDENSTDEEADSTPSSSFFGKSSDTSFIREAIATRPTINPNWKPTQSGPMPWEVQKYDTALECPPDDLIISLVNLYFDKENIYWPLLHRPSIFKAIAEGRHSHDRGFAEQILIMCASGARHSSDPRVANPNHPSPLAAGWHWFHKAMDCTWNLVGSVSLTDVQTCCLAALFLVESSAPHAAWMIAGLGIRIAQDAGAHRRHTYKGKPLLERELWKRAFYLLLSLDRRLSAALGRTPALCEEFFDVEHPMVCSDAHLEDPSLVSSQEEDMTFQTMLYFKTYLSLDQILASILVNVYIISKIRIAFSRAGLKEQTLLEGTVREIDSCLNQWYGEIPDRFQWNAIKDEVTHNQSTDIYTYYYYVSIVLHRPFLNHAHKSFPWTIPSSLIAINAARSCIAMAYEHLEHFGHEPPGLTMSVWTSGTVLLNAIWTEKATASSGYHKDLSKCLTLLKSYSGQHSQRCYDILSQLLNINQLPMDATDLPAVPAVNQPTFGLNVLEPFFSPPFSSPSSNDPTSDLLSTNDFFNIDPNFLDSLLMKDDLQSLDMLWTSTAEFAPELYKHTLYP